MKAEFGKSEDFQSLVKDLRKKFGDESLTDLVDENKPPLLGPDQLVTAHPKLGGNFLYYSSQLGSCAPLPEIACCFRWYTLVLPSN